jgi:hypothetical protein
MAPLSHNTPEDLKEILMRAKPGEQDLQYVRVGSD